MGCGGIMPQKNQALYVGNAGTVARFLTALLAIQEESSYTLDGSAEMRRRPIGQLLSLFQKGGVEVIYNQQHGHFPFTINTRNFNSNNWTVDATKSSQILSALMMIAPLLGRSKTINFPDGTVSLPFLSITKDMIKYFSGDPNFNCNVEDDHIKISAQYHRKEDFS